MLTRTDRPRQRADRGWRQRGMAGHSRQDCRPPGRVALRDSARQLTHLGVDPGLIKDGVEAHLQVLLAEHIDLLGDGHKLVP